MNQNAPREFLRPTPAPDTPGLDWRSVVPLAAAALCLLLALVKFSAYWPYQASRWALCAAGIWLAVQSTGWRRVLAGALAVIYNPFDPLAFGDLWPWVNAASAAACFSVSKVPAKMMKWPRWRELWGDVKTTVKALVGFIIGGLILAGIGGVVIHHFVEKEKERKRDAQLVAPPVDWWNWDRGALRLREYEAALNGAEAALAEINAMEREGVLTDRAAYELRKKWTWQEQFGYRSVHETKEQRAGREWIQTMALAYVADAMRGRLESLDDFTFVPALQKVTTEGKNWKVATDWPTKKEAEEFSLKDKERWEDEWYPKLCAEFCDGLRKQKAKREALLAAFAVKWKTLSHQQKLDAKKLNWSQGLAEDFVKVADASAWLVGLKKQKAEREALRAAFTVKWKALSYQQKMDARKLNWSQGLAEDFVKAGDASAWLASARGAAAAMDDLGENLGADPAKRLNEILDEPKDKEK